MNVRRYHVLHRIGATIAACCVVTACDESRVPTEPTRRAAAVTLQPFTAIAAFDFSGVFTYRISLMLRETAGVSGTLSSVTITLTDQSGPSVTNLFSATEAFEAAAIPANGTLTSNMLTLYGPPLWDASQCCPRYTVNRITARVAFTDAGGNTGTAQQSLDWNVDLTGTWTGGPLRIPASGDWSLVRTSLVHDGGIALTGQMVSQDGNRLMLHGSLATTGASITLGGSCGSAFPGFGGVSFNAREFELGDGRVQRMSGSYVGRCFGTVAGPLELRREG